MATLAELKSYLGGASDQWSDSELTGALEAETASQASRCRIPDPIPADLREALLRRVARNLAMRGATLGVIGQGEDATRVGSKDPEVRRLEAPYRKLVVG